MDKAVPVFWTHGFAATSLQDLEQATGVNKSGLYAEFASKDELFLAALRHYLDTWPGGRSLSAEPPGWDNLERFLLEASDSAGSCPGCFAVNSLREIADLPPQAHDALAAGRQAMRLLWKRNVEAEAPAMDVETLCDLIGTVFSGLCIEANLVADPSRDRHTISAFMQMLRGL